MSEQRKRELIELPWSWLPKARRLDLCHAASLPADIATAEWDALPLEMQHALSLALEQQTSGAVTLRQSQSLLEYRVRYTARMAELVQRAAEQAQADVLAAVPSAGSA